MSGTSRKAKKIRSNRNNRKSPGSDTLFVNSVEKGFRVLRAFRTGQRELGMRDLSLSQISSIAELNKSATQRFTNTLVRLGYLEKDDRTRRYRPALGLTEFYYTYIISNQLAETAMPRLIETSKALQTTVNLGEPLDTDIVYTLRIPHEKSYFRATIPGRRTPAFCTAAGIVMLANRPQDEVDAILADSTMKPITEWTVTDPKKIQRIIRKARKDGYVITLQQFLAHEISTAAPVLNSEGLAVAAIQIPVYMPRWTVEKVVEKIVPTLIETARAVSGSYFAEGRRPKADG